MASSQIVAILFHVAPSRMLLQLQCPQRNAIKTTIVVSVWHDNNSPESKRDQEEGGELDSHEEASPEEIKSRDVVLGYRERVGALLLQLFPYGGAELRTLSSWLCSA